MESDEDGGDDGASDAIVDDVDGSVNEWLFFFLNYVNHINLIYNHK